MAIELEKLLFSVDTAELDTALKKIDALSEKLDTLTTATNKTNKASNDSAKTLKNSTTETNNATDAQNQLNESTSKANAILERQKDILKFQTEGFSKGQSSVLAYAKATGAATGEIKELGNVLQMQRKLIGGDPFDKSISGLVALQNQYGEIREAMRQYSKDTELTRNQTRELTRDKERIIEKMKLEGATFSQIKNAIKAHNDEYIRTADLVNNLTNQEKMLERAQKDKLNALRSIQAAEERVRATLVALNAETEDSTKLNERAALAVGAYERNLRVAGISADEAAKRLKNFKEQQAEVTKATQRNQMDYLARGIGVQVGDIGVSLASGMNPLTVAIQQFDQIRSLIQQTGATTQEMNAVMSQAVAQIVSSFKLLGVAVGSFVAGAIKSLGEYATTWTGVNKALQLAQDNMLITEATSMRLNKAIGTVLAGSLGVIITLSAAFLIASKQMLDANNALDRSLAQFGATLGITSKEAHALAQSQTELGVTSATATNALADFAKSGITDVGMLEAALQSAIKTQKILGISTEDTAKVFADLRKKPTETLIEIAKNTGLVNAETIKYVHTLEEQGKTQEAVAIAQGAVLASMEGVRQVADVNLTEIEKLWRDIKNAVNDAWGAMQNLSQNTDFWKGVRDLFAKLKLIVTQTMNVLGGIGLAIRDLLSFDFDSDRINGFINEQNQKAADEYEATMRDIYDATSQNAEAEKKSATERQKNSEAASKLAEQFKKEKENEKKMESEAKRLRESFIRDQESLNKIRAEAEGKVELLTKAEMKLLEIQRNPDWAKRTKDEKQKLKDLAESAKQAELYANALKNTEDTFKAWGQVTKELQNQNIELDRAADSINNEYTLLGLTGVEREKASRQIEYQNDLLKAQANYQKNVLNAQANFWKRADDISKEVLSPEERAYQFELNAQMYEKTMRDAETLLNKERETAGSKTNLKVADSYYKEMQRVSDMLADVLITALTEGGKAGSKKLGDYIKKELLSASNIFISSIIRAPLGNFMQSAFGINASNFKGGTLGSNLASAATSAYNTFTGGQGLTGSLYNSFATSSLGQTIGLSSVGGMAALGGLGAGITGATLGTTVSAGGMAALGGLGGGISGGLGAGLSTGGMSAIGGLGSGVSGSIAAGASQGASLTAAGANIGAALPYIGLGVAAISLLSSSGMFSSGGAPKVDTFMGGKLTPSGVNLDTSGWNVWNADKQNTQAASALINEEFAKVIRKINPEYLATAFISGHLNIKGKSSNQQVAEVRNKQEQAIYSVFKEEGKGVEDFQKFVAEQLPKVQFALIVDAMRTASEDYKEIANLIVGDSDNLTESLKDVSQEGIAAMQSSLSSAMQAFEIAGNMFEEIGVKISGQDFKKVAEATGGFENLTALLGSYYENFYSAEEKRIHGMESLVKVFNEQAGASVTLEEALSLTKTEFRDLYEESVKLHGVANPTAVAMLKVAGSFAELNNEADEVIKTVGSLKLTTSVKTELDDSLSFIEEYVQSTKESIEEQYRVQLEAENKKLDSAKETFNSIKSQADSLKNALNSISYFKEFSTGSSSTLKDVRSALGSTGSSDYFKLMGITYDAIGNLKTDAEKQLDVAKEQVQVIERQIKAIEESKQEQVSKLDAMLQKAKDQYDAIFKVEKAVNSLADAINKLAGAASAAAQKAASPVPKPPVPETPVPEEVLSQETINKAASDIVSGFNGDIMAAADSLYSSAIQYGVSTDQLAIALGKTPENIKEWIESKGLSPLVNSTAVINPATSAINTVGTSLSVDIPEHLKKVIVVAAQAAQGKDIDGFEDSLYAISNTFGYTAEQIAAASNNSVEVVKSMLGSAESRGASPYAPDTFYFEQSQKTSEVIDKIVSNATEGVAKVVENAANDVDKLLNIIRERESLMIQEWQLLGDIASIRKLELAKVDESNRAIQERIWKLQDEQAALEFIKPFKEFNDQFGKSQAVNKVINFIKVIQDAENNLIKLGQFTADNIAILNTWFENQIKSIESEVMQGFNIQDNSYAAKVSSIKASADEAIKDLEAIGKATEANISKISKWLDYQTKLVRNEEISRLFGEVESAFNNVINSIRKDIQKLEETFAATDKAYESLVNAVNREKESKQTELDTLKNTKSELTSLIESISDAIKSLRKEVEPTNKMLVQSARNLLSSALGGASVDNKSLLEAVGTVSESVTSSLYGTKVDQERAYLLLANDLESLNKINKDSLDGSDQQILLLEQQIKSIDDVIVQAKKQIDTLRGIDTSVLTVDQAVKELNEAVAKEETARKQIDGLNQQIILATNQYEQAKQQYQEVLGIRTDITSLQTALVTAIGNLGSFAKSTSSAPTSSAPTSSAPTSSAPTSSAPTAPYSVNDSPAERQAKVEYQTGQVVSPSDSKELAAAKVLYQSVTGGANSAQATAALAAIGGSFSNIGWDGSREGAGALVVKYGGKLPGFADGGRYQGGLALVGEQGPELINFNKPGMVYNANQTASILSSDSSLSDKVERLAEAVEMLRYEARATAVNTSKMAKQLDRTSDQGDTLRVTVVA